MNISQMMKSGDYSQLEQNLMDLDSEFRFKCRRCGKCCVHQDTILLTARDIFNIAKKQGRTPWDVVREYTEVYVGNTSRMPVVHLLSSGPKDCCPLLVDGLCSVHDCKPTVCALYPLGRVAVTPKDENGAPIQGELKIRYILNDITCGSAKRINTVRSWLARFGIAEEDEFFIQWNKLVVAFSELIRRMEQEDCVAEEVVEAMESLLFASLYLDYDTEQEFMPQFRHTQQKLMELHAAILKNLNQEAGSLTKEQITVAEEPRHESG